MPRIDTVRRKDRKAAILDAAERCFARSGFHAASMSEICAEAGMSPGGLYRYFPSKEAMIEGLCERDLADAEAGFAQLVEAEDIWEGLRRIARFHLVEEPRESCVLWIETLSEVTRNPQIMALRTRTDRFIHDALMKALEAARRRGQVRAEADLESAVEFMLIHADGMMLRRASNPGFDPMPQVEAMLAILGAMLAPPAAALNDNAPAAAE